MKRIIFFTRTTEPTGSETALYNLLYNINTDIFEVIVASQKKGYLSDKLSNKIIFESLEEYEKRESKLLKRFYRKLVSKKYLEFWEYLQQKYKPDCWYVNTLNQSHLLEYAYQNEIRTILHTHEIDNVFYYLKDYQIKYITEHPFLIVACSNYASQIINNLGRTKSIEISYPAINIDKIRSTEEKRKSIRQDLGINENTFVWAMSGYLDVNKNPIRFVQIADILLKTEDVYFIWLGNDEDQAILTYLKSIANKKGINDKINWLGKKTEDYYDYLNISDGLFLTSYKETFSMIVIEALTLKKPVVTSKTGGVSEILIEEGLGIIVDSWNDTDIAKEMKKVMNGEFVFDDKKAEIMLKRFDFKNQNEQWENILSQYIT